MPGHTQRVRSIATATELPTVRDRASAGDSRLADIGGFGALSRCSYDGSVFLPLSYLLGAALLALAGYGAFLTARGRAIDNALFYLLCAVEVLMILALVLGLVTWNEADAQMNKGVFAAYLIGMVIATPIAGFWAFADRETRWGTGVLVVAATGLLVMTVRLVQLWGGYAG